MGSKYVSITESTSEQTQKMESSGIDISVAAEASAFGQSAGTSVLSDEEQKESEFYESNSKTFSQVSLRTS